MKPNNYNLAIKNPEYSTSPHYTDTPHAIINLGAGEVRVFKGDFRQLDLMDVFAIDAESQIPNTSIISVTQDGLSYKQLMQMKSLTDLLIQKSYLMNLPVIITGEESLRKKFYSFLQKNYRVILYPADATHWTTTQILKESEHFKKQVTDLYEEEINLTLSKLNKANRVVTDLDKIVQLILKNEVLKIYFAPSAKIYGRIHWDLGQVELLESIHPEARDILNELFQKTIDLDLRSEILPKKFFNDKSECMCIVKQGRRWNSIAI